MFKKLCFVFALLSLIINFCYLKSVTAEDITITTYYPSPHGSYDELGANKLAVDVDEVAVPGEYAAMQDGDAHIGNSLIVGLGGSGYSYAELTATLPADGTLLVKDKVGIGTNDPRSRLHIMSNTVGGVDSTVQLQAKVAGGAVGNNSPGINFLDSSGANKGAIGLAGWATAWADSSVPGDTVIRGVNGSNIIFGTNAGGVSTASTRMYIRNSNGNVGIGTTNPIARLHIIAPGGVTVGPEPLRLQSNSSFLSGFDGAGTQRFAINNDAGPFLKFYGSDTGWFNFMTVNNSGVTLNDGISNIPLKSVAFSSGPVTINNTFQDKLIFAGTNIDTNTVVWTNDKGIRFWDPVLASWNGAAGPIMTISRAGSTGSVTINSVAVPLMFYEVDTGIKWRMPLDAGYMRFDKNTGTDFSSYYTPIAMDTNGYALVAYGAAYSTSGGWQGSDLKWKKNVETLSNPLNKLLKLRGVSFNWKREEFKENAFPEGRQIGIIAQEMEKQFPELVKTDEKGYKAVAYDKFTVLLLEGMKAQQKEIEELKEQVKELKTKIK